MELGLQELIVIFVVALLVYGGKLPQVAVAVGRSLGELKRGLRSTTDAVRREIEDVDPRRAVRRAWEPASPRTALPSPGVPAPVDVATEDISAPPATGAETAASDAPASEPEPEREGPAPN